MAGTCSGHPRRHYEEPTVRPEVAGPMTSSATKQSRSQLRARNDGDQTKKPRGKTAGLFLKFREEEFFRA